MPASSPPRIVFVFTGQGGEWPGMGRALLRTEPRFRAALDRFDGALRAAAGWSLLEALDADDARWADPEVAMPALVAVGVGLAEVWRGRGVRPDAVVGQSVGEAAAACVAGALSEDEAARVALAYGRAVKRARPGGLLLTGLDAAGAARAVEAHPGAAFVAGRLSPGFTSVAGSPAALEALRASLAERGVYAQTIRVPGPVHSPLAAGAADGLRADLAGLDPRPPAVPLVSSVTGARVEGRAFDADYWVRNLCAPTELAAALEAALADGPAALLEVSPGAGLAAILEDAVEAHRDAGPVLASHVRGEDPSHTLRAAHARLAGPAAPADGPEPLAIVGMACRLPGGIDGPDVLWAALHEGREVVGEIPPSRWDVEAVYDPEPGTPSRMYTRWAGFLDGTDRFDAGFFRISPREAQAMDPQHRLLLETTWEALEHAGIAPDTLEGTRAGVYTGISQSEHELLMTEQGDPEVAPYTVVGTSGSVASGRVAYLLGLRGPALSVDTACSSSLTALHLAAQNLRSGEADLALVGGVNAVLAPTGLIGRCQSRMMSPTGRCHSFDAAADGYVESEGCAVLVVKRLADARRDGDRVLALVRGTASNQDGRSAGMMAPSGEAQEAVVRRALAAAGLGPDDVQYVEAHGTGTPVGDPIELHALQAVFGERPPAERPGGPVLLGSVKANVGHCEAAAGAVGIVKAVLALTHGEAPPHPHLGAPTPAFDWDAGALAVPTRPTAWPATPGPRRAGVSSFGISGTNVHVVLEEAPPPPPPAAPAAGPAVLPLSARTGDDLGRLADRFARHLDAVAPADFADACATAARGRAHLDRRLAVVAASPGEAADALRRFAAGDPSGVVGGDAAAADAPGVAFLFTGQGAQYPGMGLEAYDREPAFRDAIDRCAEIAGPLLDRPLLDVLFGRTEADGALVHQTAYTQPALFAVEYAASELWRSWGVRPAAVLGHSVGEYVAACVAGAVGLEDALRLVIERGRLMQALPVGAGAMAAVLAPEAEVVRAVAEAGGGVSVAGVNGPENVVISGAVEAVEALGRRLAAGGAVVKALTVSHAFHSSLMDPMLEAFEAAASRVAVSEPEVPLVSNVTGRVAEPGELADPSYWARHVREGVQYRAGVEALWGLGLRTFLEVGPHPVLVGMGRACVPSGGTWVPSLRRGQDDRAALLGAVAELYTRGVELDWASIAPGGARRALPTYPFQRRHFPIGDGPGGALRLGQRRAAVRTGGHPLVGPAVSSPALPGPLFEAVVAPGSPGFPDGHRIDGVPVVPGMGFLEVATAAARAAFGEGAYEAERVTITKALAFAEGQTRTVQVALSPEGDGRHAFRVFSRADDGDWTEHAAGVVGPVGGPPPDDRPGLEAETVGLEAHDTDRPIARLLERGLALSGPYLNLERILSGEDRRVLARVRLPDAAAAEAARFGLHPALLDGCIQAIGVSVPDVDTPGRLHVPLGARRFQVFQTGCTDVWCEGSFEGEGDWDYAMGSVRIYDLEGRPVATLEGLELQRIAAAAIRRLVQPPTDDWAYRVGWEPDATPAATPQGRWLVLADRGGVGDAAADRLREGGATAVVARATGAPGEGPAVDPADAEAVARIVGAEAWDGVACLWPLDGPAPGAGGPVEALRDGLGGVLHVVQAAAAEGTRTVVATRGAVAGVEAGDAGGDGHASAAWGLVRTASTEHPELRPVAVDLPAAASVEAAADAVVEALGLDGEPALAVRGGTRYRARLQRHAPADWAWTPDAPYRLEAVRRGDLDGLRLVAADRRPPGPGEVEVAVLATGLNFRDVLNALGMYPGDAGPLGAECAGRVVAVGEGVGHVAVGDEVVALAPGAFRSFVTVPGAFVVRRPATASLAEAATLPITFLTAYQGLHWIAGLQPGQRVLVHAAAGGVGMAAVQIARRAGAEVYGTAGTDEKRALVRALGAAGAFDSRSLSFADDVMAATGGEGLDVVLNALTGPFIPAGLGVLRDGGHFLELGKRELWTRDQVDAVNPTLHYTPYDLGDAMRDEPAAVHEMLRAVAADVEAGALAPLPVTTFGVGEAPDAFRYMAQARHVGKVVVLHPDLEPAGAPVVRPDATYLVTGGLGGLGLRLAERLVERGATHLVLAGRSAPSEAAAAAVEALRERADVHVARADVSDRASVEALLAEARDGRPPLRGVFHAAGVIEDALLARQGWPQVARVLAPKVAGGRHLDRATRRDPLDHFVLFSSIAAVLGSAGQGAYAAANAALDRLAARRRAEGLPALSVNWGPWDEVGMAARLDAHYRDQMRRAGLGLIPVEAGLDVLERLMREARTASGPASVVVQPFAWDRIASSAAPPILRGLARAAAAPTTARPADDGARRLVRDLEAAAPADRQRIAVDDLRARIGRVTGAPAAEVPTDRPLTTLGLESLMAVEFKGQVEAAYGATLSVAALLRGATLEDVAEDVLAQRFGAVEAPDPAVGGDGAAADGAGGDGAALDPGALLDRLDTLSEAEVDALLAQTDDEPPSHD